MPIFDGIEEIEALISRGEIDAEHHLAYYFNKTNDPRFDEMQHPNDKTDINE